MCEGSIQNPAKAETPQAVSSNDVDAIDQLLIMEVFLLTQDQRAVSALDRLIHVLLQALTGRLR